MPKLTRVVVKNFQALKNLVLELGPGVNVIRGRSDNGKSSLVRALSCVFYQGEGDWFVRDGAKHAAVSVETDDDHAVEWKKGKSKNEYKLDGTRFGRVGRSVPEPVVEVLGVRPVQFGADTERRLHVQRQGEHGFLVNDSGAECARIIGGISGASVLADAVRRCSADVTKFARCVSDAEARCTAPRAALSAYDGVDTEVECAAHMLDLVEGMALRVRALDELRAVIAEAHEVSAQRQDAMQRLVFCRAQLVAFDELDELRDRSAQCLEQATLAEEHGEAWHDARTAEDRVGVARARLNGLIGVVTLAQRFNASASLREANVECIDTRHDMLLTRNELDVSREAVAAYAGLGALEERAATCDGMSVLANEWQSAHAEDEAARKASTRARHALEKVETEYAEYVRTNPTCPTCGQMLPTKGVK